MTNREINQTIENNLEKIERLKKDNEFLNGRKFSNGIWETKIKEKIKELSDLEETSGDYIKYRDIITTLEELLEEGE